MGRSVKKGQGREEPQLFAAKSGAKGGGKGKARVKDPAPQREPRRRRRRSFLWPVIRFGITLAILGTIGLGALFGYIWMGLDSQGLLKIPDRDPGIMILANDGSVLAEQGYRYSSSVAPIVHDHYGWREAPRFAFRPVQDAGLIEIPVTTAEIAGRRMAAGGGGFFRILPYAVSRWAITRVNAVDRRPAVFYFHPWEIDPGQPRRADAPLRSRLRHYTNLCAMAGKLDRLIGDFRWGRMDALAAIEAVRAA